MPRLAVAFACSVTVADSVAVGDSLLDSVAGGPDRRPRHVHHGLHVVRQHPAGLPDISHPVLHKKAGGSGTYADPVTIAVGHSLETGKDLLDFPADRYPDLPS